MSDTTVADLIARRFGQAPEVPAALNASPPLKGMVGRGSCRRFQDAPVTTGVLETLAAAALAAPSKSDLQQCNILLVTKAETMARLKAVLEKQAWVAGAPALVVFLANNRRQRQIQRWRGQPFPNDHLDTFFNASVDAAIGLAFFIAATEAAGLGCCPISAIRNALPQVRDILALPDHVFPVAALAVGYPADPEPAISPRLPLDKTVHHDRFTDITEGDIDAYDHWRAGLTPFGQAPTARATHTRPLWSEAKARSYAKPHRADFGGFIREIGFKLD